MGMQLPSPTSPALAREARQQEAEQHHTAQQRALALMERKDEIQAQIDTNLAILKQNGSSMRTPLLTPDGFPRADIDVFAVRTARVRVIELRNDLEAIMGQIAKALEGCLGPVQASGSGSQNGGVAEKHDESDGEPFARVDGVAPSSPASEAGLRRDDLILAFGPLSTRDRSIASLAPLAEVTQSHENRDVIVIVQREQERKRITLRPRKGWGGRGMLGCHIVPYRP